MTRTTALTITAMLFSLALAGCSKKDEAPSEAYLAACEGPPLRTNEERNAALEQGYYNQQFRCIDKEAYAAVRKNNEAWEAAQTPEVIAEREAVREQQQARQAERVAGLQAAAEEEQAALKAAGVVIVDVNTGTLDEIAGVISIGRDVAAQIVNERRNGPFKDWNDLITRVAVFNDLAAVHASVCGLNVNGESMYGARPSAQAAAAIQESLRKKQAG